MFIDSEISYSRRLSNIYNWPRRVHFWQRKHFCRKKWTVSENGFKVFSPLYTTRDLILLRDFYIDSCSASVSGNNYLVMMPKVLFYRGIGITTGHTYDIPRRCTRPPIDPRLTKDHVGRKILIFGGWRWQDRLSTNKQTAKECVKISKAP